jgi:hypothetical protein
MDEYLSKPVQMGDLFAMIEKRISRDGKNFNVRGIRLDEEGNVILVHYDDLRVDLCGQMRHLAARLRIDVPDELWPSLVAAATFEHMKSRADMLVPDPSGVLKSRQAFFRNGVSGAGRALLTPAQVAKYEARAAQLAPTDLLAWLHRPVG